VLVYLVMLGAYYAATDGVLMALASFVLPPELRTSGLALLTTATGSGRLLASILFGALWTLWGVDTAVFIFVIGLAAATVVAAITLVRGRIQRDQTA
jgi:MFS family permease